jgi:hypothetical protein
MASWRIGRGCGWIGISQKALLNLDCNPGVTPEIKKGLDFHLNP